MSSKKRFQTGREIMEAFIPDYEQMDEVPIIQTEARVAGSRAADLVLARLNSALNLAAPTPTPQSKGKPNSTVKLTQDF